MAILLTILPALKAFTSYLFQVIFLRSTYLLRIPRTYYSLLTIIGICFTTSLFSQSSSLNISLAQNFQADGHILEIIAPHDFIDQNIIIGWQNTNGQQFSEQIRLKSGKNIIFPKAGWNGNIQVLATNIQRLEAKIVEENFGHKFSAFLSPNLMTPGSINFDRGFYLGKYMLSNILLVILLLASLIFYFIKKRSIQSALLFGSIVSFLVLDARQIKNQFDIINTFNHSKKEISPFEGLGPFFKNCEATIGEDIWKLNKLPGVWNSYAKYNLAAKSMIPKKNINNLKPNYLITNTPNAKGQILLQSRGIKLIKKN